MKVLVVVDMQNDFIDGALGTKEAVQIVPKVVERIRHFDGLVIATRDTHDHNYLETEEGRNLPVSHCIKGTEGWKIRKEIQDAVDEKEGSKVIDKPSFGSTELGEYLKSSLDSLNEITLTGLCTDICVISNALLLKAYLPEVRIRVAKDCCAGVTPESHEQALGAMSVCQIEIV